MSNTVSDPKVLSLSAFNAESILSHFGGRGVLPDFDASCIRALYNYTLDENKEFVAGVELANLSKRSIDNTMNKIGERYQLFVDFADGVLVHGSARDAMALAVILDSDFYSIFPDYSDKERLGPGGLYDGEVVRSAELLLDESILISGAVGKENVSTVLEDVSFDARVLAQICLISNLKEELDNSELPTYEELSRFVCEEIATSFVVADLDTDLGLELNELAQHIRSRALSYCDAHGYPNPESLNSGPDLRLV